MERQLVQLQHASGLKFKVYLTLYEINRAETDDNFSDEIIEKYYSLYRKGHLRGSVGGNSDNIQEKVVVSKLQENTEEENICKNGAGPSIKNLEHIWTTDCIKLLLNLRLGRENEFEKPTCKKFKLWGLIAKEMINMGYSSVTADICYTKYRNLLQTYRANKEKKLKTSGESKITWEYYEIMDDVLGRKAASIPKIEILSSSIKEELQQETEITQKFSNKKNSARLHNISGRPIKRLKRKMIDNTKEMSLQRYLYLKNEKDNQRWKEQKELKQQTIAAINNLADAIRSANTLGNTK